MTETNHSSNTLIGQLKISYVTLDQLTPDPDNPRKHNKKHVTKIANSIKTFKFNNPILADENNTIIAGHGRLLAAKQLALSEVPVIHLNHLTKAQKKALQIADNKLTEDGEWDKRSLAQCLKDLSIIELDFNLDVTGFEMPQIDFLIQSADSTFEEHVESDEGDDQPLVCQPGDLWLCDNHRIYCGNSLETAAFKAVMDGKLATMVFTDPPYNVPINGHVSGTGAHNEFQMASGEMSRAEFIQFLASFFHNVQSYSKDGSIHYVCMDWRHGAEVQIAGASYNEFKNMCVWVKDNGGMGTFYRSRHELVYVFKHGTAAHINNFELGQHGRYRTNVWEYSGANSFSRSSNSEDINPLTLHPTVKPLEMVADAIMDCSNRGDIILDPFLGSGTTLVAAEKVSRICYGIEIDPRYVDRAIRRWQNFTGKKAVNSATGKNFNESTLTH